LATSAKTEFSTPLIFNDLSVNASENFSKLIFKTMSAAEHFSKRYSTSAVPGRDGQAVSSSTAVLGPHGQATSSPSTGPGPNGQVDFSSSSTVTGRRPPTANGGQPVAIRAAAWLLSFQFSFNFCCNVIRTWLTHPRSCRPHLMELSII
jgi:hypothetical protein